MSLAPVPKKAFCKPATTLDEQVELLRSRGMQIDDGTRAKFYLQHLNYYRLTGYWLPFEADHATHQFKPGANFETILSLYTFDRELRLLLLDAIERVEVSTRAQWAYVMAHRHGPHSHLDRSLAFKRGYYDKNYEDLEKEVRRADEQFITHLRQSYSEALPPIWAVCEVMSLGVLSRWFSNIKPSSTRSEISGAYKTDEKVFGSWLHHLSIVRNRCAHHSRVWNYQFAVLPMRPKSKSSPICDQMLSSNHLYNTLVILLYLMDIVAPAHTWRSRLLALIEQCPMTLDNMGFPDNWRTQAIWGTK